VDVRVDGKPFTTLYLGGEGVTKPYFHPLRSADGTIITRGYPMEQIAGESKDHPHHRGLWFSHGAVSGVNFWENERSVNRPNMGLIVFDNHVKAKGGKTEGTLETRFKWTDKAGTPMLEELRTVTVRTGPNIRIMDFDITLKALKEVKFEDTKEGTFSVRLADALIEKKGGHMVNAAGASGMKEVWGKPSPWVDYWGEIDGKKVGLAMMDHPSNPKHPTYWHCRDYGLCGANMFGEHDFFNDPKRDGSVTLPAGKTMHLRYRVLIHAGDTASAEIAKNYAAYSHGSK